MSMYLFYNCISLWFFQVWNLNIFFLGYVCNFSHTLGKGCVFILPCVDVAVLLVCRYVIALSPCLFPKNMCFI
jgi:hypothetical protein